MRLETPAELSARLFGTMAQADKRRGADAAAPAASAHLAAGDATAARREADTHGEADTHREADTRGEADVGHSPSAFSNIAHFAADAFAQVVAARAARGARAEPPQARAGAMTQGEWEALQAEEEAALARTPYVSDGPPREAGRAVRSGASHPPTGSAIPFIWAADIAEGEDGAPELVEGILTAGAMCVIYGESNSGKTYLVLDLACAVARGVPWLGRRTTPGAVIYVAAEGARTIERRVRAYRKHHGLEGAAADFPLGIVKTALDLCTSDVDTGRLSALIGVEVPRRAAYAAMAEAQVGGHVSADSHASADGHASAHGHASAQALEDAAPVRAAHGATQAQAIPGAERASEREPQAPGAALIIIDTLSRAIAGGNENASEDMGALVRNGDRLRELTGAHVLWVHHTGKDTARGARGHSLLRAATDTEIEVSCDKHSGLRTARITKQRDLDSNGQEIHARLKALELGRNQWGGAVTACVVEGLQKNEAPVRFNKPLRPALQRALDAIDDAPTAAVLSGEGTSVIPPGKRMVLIDDWRDAYRKRCGDLGDSTFRSYWSRTQRALLDAGRVGAYEKWAWRW